MLWETSDNFLVWKPWSSTANNTMTSQEAVNKYDINKYISQTTARYSLNLETITVSIMTCQGN